MDIISKKSTVYCTPRPANFISLLESPYAAALIGQKLHTLFHGGNNVNKWRASSALTFWKNYIIHRVIF